MGSKEVAEMADVQENSLSAEAEGQKTQLAAVAGPQCEVESLMIVAERVRRALVPVEPSPDFVRNLRRNLLAMAERKQPTASPSARRVLLIGAAALGSVLSVAGIIVYVVYARANAGAKTPIHG
jgi:hypothetical protein